MPLWFLILVLFFPRITLLFSWITNNIPMNDTPFWADALMAFMFPRFLVAYWGYELNVHMIWIVALVLFGLAEIFGGGVKASNSKSSD